MKLYHRCVFGGSFNPITNSHVEIIKILCGMCDVVAIMPCNHHVDGKGLEDYEDRVEMCYLANQEINLPNSPYVSTFEKRYFEPTETYDILCDFRDDFYAHNIAFAVGLDVFNSMRNWAKGLRIVEEFPLIVFGVGDGQDLTLKPNDRFISIDGVIHSSDVRRMRRDRDGRWMDYVPRSVSQFILENNLYG